MQYKAYTYGPTRNPDNKVTVFSGYCGCWGALANNFGGKIVDEIHYSVDMKSLSVAEQLLGKKGDQTSQQFIEKCEPLVTKFLRNCGFKFEFYGEPRSTGVWIRFFDMNEVPRNHTMWYLFLIRCFFEYQYSSHIIPEMTKRGIKSPLKLAISALLFQSVQHQQFGLVGENRKPLLLLYPFGSGGTPWNYNLHKFSDIRAFYAGRKLRGWKDKPWKAGGGYTSGDHGITVQGSSAVCTSGRRAVKDYYRLSDATSFFSELAVGMSDVVHNQRKVSNQEEVKLVLDRLADFLKSLK